MHAIPREVLEGFERHVTGVTCPDCSGVLQAQREGRGTLRFICRVGHTLSVDELLAAKEDKLESDMWAAVRGAEELVALLDDLDAHADRLGREQIGGPHGVRIAQAREHAHRLRALVDEKRPVDLTGAADERGAVQPARTG